ncbi:MAG: hypothetical protein O7H39_14630 [Gammaproteobacteria bacterium]|nr:hypothetical protein [Gammaproteobacteria bacterium]
MSVLSYFHPTTVIFIDDNELFLRGLDAELPRIRPFELHHDPCVALDAVNRILKTGHLADRVFTHREQAPDASSATVHLDLSLIEQEIKLTDRFRHVSIAFIDYAMPGIDGLEFSAGIEDPFVKKILLTGVADEHRAVAAFNDGLIHKYLPKQATADPLNVLKVVREMERAYFAELHGRMNHALADTAKSFIDDAHFIEHFNQTCAELHIVEYYRVNQPLGYLLLDAAGSIHRMLVADALEFDKQYSYARAHSAPANVIDALQGRQAIGFFYEPVETFFDHSKFTWDDYLVPVTRQGPDWYAALAPDPPVDIDYDPAVSSLSSFMASLGPRVY